jgi:ABC-type phosphate transport system substrate-binding protein
MSKFGGILLALAALAGTAPATAQAQGYVVIVNSGNATTSLPKATVSKLFLKQTKSWPAGGAVQPVDQDRAAAPRAAFSTAVHGRSVASVEEFWLQQVFAGKDEPPAMQKDDAAVIAFVSTTPGAVGYVSASATLPGGVRKVTVTP